MIETLRDTRKSIERKQFNLRLEEMLNSSQQYDLLRAIYLLDRRLSIQNRNLDESEVRNHIRFKGVTTLNFESSDIFSVEYDKVDKHIINLATPFFSFTANSGPLPQSFCELILSRERKKEYATSDFLDIFVHRLVTLFYLGRKKRDPSLVWGQNFQTSMEKIVDSLASLGRSSTEFKKSTNIQWLKHAGIFGGAPRSSTNLRTLIKDRYNLSIVNCWEFYGAWSGISGQRKGLKAGLDAVSLGNDAVLGTKSWSLSSGILIEIKNLDLKKFLSFLPTEENYSQIVTLVYRFLPRGISIFLNLHLGKSDIRNFKLSNQSGMRLGWNTWIGDITKADLDIVKLEFRLNENRL